MMDALRESEPATPTPGEVQEALDRILASGVVASSPGLSRFVRHVVEQTSEGRSDQLKEFAIGTDVFDRAEAYDPRIDSVADRLSGWRGCLAESRTCA